MTGNNIGPLTFGVEFEFMVKSLPLAFGFSDRQLGDPEPEDSRPASWDELAAHNYSEPDVEQHLRDLLTTHGISCAKPENQDLPSAKREAEIPYRKWTVDNDITVEAHSNDYNEAYIYASIEITTPIYYASEKRNMGFDEIRKVLSIIRNNFRVYVPPTAGLHVHVGNGMSGFTTTHMRNLMSIFYVFDKQIQIIHPNRQFHPTDRARQKRFKSFYRAPSQCNLGHYLTGVTGEDNNLLEFDKKKDLSIAIVRLAPGEISTDAPTEFSQARRFSNKEREVERRHIRMRQFFASGPESMTGIGSTNIKYSQPGVIAQRLFRNEPTGIPLIKLTENTEIGAQLYAHITKHLKQELDSEIKDLLLIPTSLDNSKKHAHPTNLLSTVKLSQAEDLRDLDYLSGTGSRNAAYNIHGLAYSQNYGFIDVDGKRTVEFRQHQGSLDAERTIAWVQMVTGIVEWVRFAPPVKFAKLLSIGGRLVPEEFDVVDLLRYMKLDSPADYYEREFFQTIA